ncbi:MAG: 3-dehydroquinate synthase, partial [Caldisericia bacterium]|nr:3-dehydroquinate synthase [Caldisericia bacterium]
MYKKREKVYSKIPIKVSGDKDENFVVEDIISLFKKFELNEPQKILFELGVSFRFKKEIFSYSIIDKKVFDIYNDRFNFINSYLIKYGEKSKNLKEYFKIINFLSNLKFEKNNSLYIIGGGVSGDIGGFVASTYMRGVNFYLIPTTLISQVDSSIGGKNGVNLRSGKNLVGTIYIPEEVIIDPSFLFTLNKKEILSGLGEIFKYSILNENGIFDILEKKENIDYYEIINLIIPSIKEKIFWIKDDLFEKKNKRIFLNLGHTTGHMLETLFGFGKISHGEAVSFGLIFSSYISKREKLMREELYERIFKIYKKLGFNYKKFLKIKEFKDEEIYNALLLDKKSKDRSLNLIVPQNIGEVKIFGDF